ncbi:MAG: hypothetical protein WCL57_01845 [Chloroflexota bacterium]
MAEANALQAKCTLLIDGHIAFWLNSPVQRWNEIAHNLVVRNNIVPIHAL